MRLWQAFIEAQRPLLSPDNIRRLESLKLISFHAREIRIEAPGPFEIAWFDEHIRPRFELFAKMEGYPSLKIALWHTDRERPESESESKSESKSESGILCPYFTLESFIFPSHPLFDSRSLWLSGAYNPLCFIGPEKSGKTHILQALAQSMEQKPLYIDAAEWIRRYTKSVREKQVAAFRKEIRSFSALLIDNVDIFAGKRASQEELFHTFNALHERGTQLIFSLKSLDGLEPRIATRLQWGLLLPLHPLQEAGQIEEALIQKARYFGAKQPEEIARYIAKTFGGFERACSAIEALFLRLPKGVDATPQRAELVLQDLIASKPKHLDGAAIIAAVASHFDLSIEELKGKGKARRLSWPRRVAFALLRRHLRLSYPAIGALFGRDHTSVLFALRTADKERLAAAIAALDLQKSLDKDDKYQEDRNVFPRPLEVGVEPLDTTN